MFFHHTNISYLLTFVPVFFSELLLLFFLKLFYYYLFIYLFYFIFIFFSLLLIFFDIFVKLFLPLFFHYFLYIFYPFFCFLHRHRHNSLLTHITLTLSQNTFFPICKICYHQNQNSLRECITYVCTIVFLFLFLKLLIFL